MSLPNNSAPDLRLDRIPTISPHCPGPAQSRGCTACLRTISRRPEWASLQTPPCGSIALTALVLPCGTSKPISAGSHCSDQSVLPSSNEFPQRRCHTSATPLPFAFLAAPVPPPVQLTQTIPATTPLQTLARNSRRARFSFFISCFSAITFVRKIFVTTLYYRSL